MPTYEDLESIAFYHGSSFYLFYPERFLRNLDELNTCFKSIYPNVQLGYALKANYMPVLCKLLRDNGYMAEVVSGLEYDIARQYLPGESLIFNGPCKKREEIRRGIEDKAIVNLDSFHELEILKTIVCDYSEVRIGLRVSFDIGKGISRFGFNYENNEFSRAVSELRKLNNVLLVSVHSHFTTKERNLELFDRRVTGMLKVYDSLPEKELIEYFNIGGGYFGPMSDSARNRLPAVPPTFKEYASVIAGHLSERFPEAGPKLIIEPGVSVVADSMDYVVQVLDEKTAQDTRYLTVDGSINSLFPTGSLYIPDFSAICQERNTPRKCHVSGYTCMEHDILLNDIDISASVGDFLVFHNRGAYSNVYKPPFIKAAPAIVGIDGSVYANRQTADEILSPYVLE